MADLEGCLQAALAEFKAQFGGESPSIAVYAPGRVNLIGEHTDYNDGFVLPMALPLVTVIVGRRSSSKECRLVSKAVNDLCPPFPVPAYPPPGLEEVNLDGPRWALYVKGVVALMNKDGGVPVFDAVITSCVPLGGGVSSSASLEVATCLFVEQLKGGCGLGLVDKAMLCQQSEHRYAGNKCGIMDQFVSVMAQEGHALLIDCRDHATENIPLSDPSLVVMVTDTGKRHELSVGGEYNKRRESCYSAASKMGVASLRLAKLEQLEGSGLTDVELRRARHVITEIARTQDARDALKNGDYKTFGHLMNQSHASLRYTRAMHH
ncbi:galactokinase-like isoform X2 [Halichondria panicea]|uniref:galactokinase-like isoform X2 n=1 Tax=Halichondria panicea TaxID=6063 RepID=UPI00312B4198